MLNIKVVNLSAHGEITDQEKHIYKIARREIDDGQLDILVIKRQGCEYPYSLYIRSAELADQVISCLVARLYIADEMVKMMNIDEVSYQILRQKLLSLRADFKKG